MDIRDQMDCCATTDVWDYNREPLVIAGGDRLGNYLGHDYIERILIGGWVLELVKCFAKITWFKIHAYPFQPQKRSSMPDWVSHYHTLWQNNITDTVRHYCNKSVIATPAQSLVCNLTQYQYKTSEYAKSCHPIWSWSCCWHMYESCLHLLQNPVQNVSNQCLLVDQYCCQSGWRR